MNTTILDGVYDNYLMGEGAYPKTVFMDTKVCQYKKGTPMRHN